MTLLTWSQAKTDKSLAYGYLTGILHLAPYNLSGANVCQYASNGCINTCLNTAGRGAFNNVQQARINKTKLFFDNPKAFAAILYKEIGNGLKKACKMNMQLAIRLNGTSDLPWHRIAPELFAHYPNVQFYDYTKDAKRMREELPRNYDLTFSRSEANIIQAFDLLKAGKRIAFVYRGNMPIEFHNRPVYDGDIHDLRFLDPKHCGIALRAKGKAKKDTTGFVMDY